MIWDSLQTINSSRLTLRAITDNDLDPFYNIFSNPEVMRYWSTPPLANKNAARQLLAEIHDAFKKREHFKWGIALRTDNQLIGTATLFHLDFGNRRCEMGYCLAREHWGKGYMNEALNALLGYAFGELGMHRIEADVDPRNTNSIKTLERLGFEREGYLRERWHVNGEIQDALFFGLLRPEWKR